jgi:hypothetical protein
MRVQQQGDTLQLEYMKPEWIAQLLKDQADAVKHETMDDAVLLTAQPKILQDFLTQYDGVRDAWGECNPLTRRAAQ